MFHLNARQLAKAKANRDPPRNDEVKKLSIVDLGNTQAHFPYDVQHLEMFMGIEKVRIRNGDAQIMSSLIEYAHARMHIRKIMLKKVGMRSLTVQEKSP